MRCLCGVILVEAGYARNVRREKMTLARERE